MRRSDGSSDDGSAPTLTASAEAADQLLVTIPTGAVDLRGDRHGEEIAVGALVGRYQLEERLGAGAMGVVWSASDPQLDRKVAIKVVHPNLARAPDAATRLLREARAMAKLSHRAVVTVHDAGDVAGQLFVAMELVRGTTLGALLRERGPAGAALDWRRWFAMMRDAGRGLAAAHEAGVLHRDFKPDNVLVGTSGRVCVADFGLATLGPSTGTPLAVFANPDVEARRRTDPALGDIDLTATGALLGTPAYMSLEQLRGEIADARSDQFAFCVAMWEALFGARPFVVASTGLDGVVALADAIEDGPPPVPADTAVPPAIGAVLRRGLAAGADARWPDMTALLDALDEAAATDSMPGGVPSPLYAETFASPRVSRTRWLLVASLAGAIAVVAVMIVVVAARREAPPVESFPRAGLGMGTAGARDSGPSLPAQRFYGVPVQSELALSPDGTRLAIGEAGIDIRLLDDSKHWRNFGSADRNVGAIVFDGDQVRYAMRTPDQLFRWDYLHDAQPVLESESYGGQWVGAMASGDLIYDLGRFEFRVDARGQTVRSWTTAGAVGVRTISPDRGRVAYIEESRSTGVVVVYDVATGRSVRSPTLSEPTALGWRDDQTLYYATSTAFDPTIWSVAVGPTSLGAPRAVHTQPTGWFSKLIIRGDTIFTVEVEPRPKTSVVESSSGQSHDLDSSTASVAMGWLDDERFYVWDRRSSRVDIRDSTQPRGETPIQLDGEPVNTTLTESVLIAAVRRKGGREIVAWDRNAGTVRWRKPVGDLYAVRCAGDRSAPCFAIRTVEQTTQVLAIDPATGTVGADVGYTGAVEDLAVSPAGTELAIAGPTYEVVTLDLRTHAVARTSTGLSTTRSIAYRPRGGFLVAGTIGGTTYQYGQLVDGVWSSLSTKDGEILLLLRPSPKGTRLHVLSRVYDSALYRLGPPLTAP